MNIYNPSHIFRIYKVSLVGSAMAGIQGSPLAGSAKADVQGVLNLSLAGTAMDGFQGVHKSYFLELEMMVEAEVNRRLQPLESLESLASFFPKFSYDDKTDKDSDATMYVAHATMCEALTTGNYQIRISPKHSGSLALWNIAKKFFQAKNSAGNLFTETSQAILAYIIASFCEGETPEAKLEAAKLKIERMKQECPDLCVGMEIVGRGMTGEHGDMPIVNYAVVTSVCRLNEDGSRRFFTASEVTQFCVKWGLLWNEAFLITSPEKFQQFCDLHARELVHGTDSSFMPQLCALADTYIPGIPHRFLQGDRLEGVVVRLEPRDTAHIDVRDALASFSLETLKHFSAALDDKWSVAERNDSTFRAMLLPEIEAFWGPNQVVKLGDQESQAALEELMSSNPQGKIADLIWFLQTDEKCAKGIHYHGYRLAGRIFFILHVLHDDVFEYLNKHKPAELMPLYRGFSFWLGEGPFEEGPIEEGPIEEGQIEEVFSAPESTGISCMFKAKLMPYMIRTFIMRNGGSKLCKAGPAGLSIYEATVDRYLKSWCSTSEQLADAIGTYRAYLLDWGRFLCSRMTSGDFEPLNGGYLHLIPIFEELRASQKKSSSQTQWGGVIVVTYPNKVGDYHKAIEAMFTSFVTIDASVKNIHKSIESGEIKSYVAAGTTVIIVTSITGNGVIKGLEEALAPVHCVSLWVHCGVAEDLTSINSGQGRGILPKWHALLKKLPYKIVPPSLARDSLSHITDFKFLRSELVPVKSVFQQIVQMPVLPLTKVSIVIMPMLPGSGKTTLTDLQTLKELAEETGYKVIFFDGDNPALKEKYWTKLRDFISKLPLFGKRYVIICSKNAPPTSRNGLKTFYRDRKELLSTGVKVMAILPNDCGTPTHSFSLEFLLLCISRVVKRTAETHPTLHGPEAWTVVRMFYNLYVDMDRGALVRSLSVLTTSLITLPLISQTAGPMPQELCELLTRGIQDAASVSTEEMMIALEKHAEYIRSLSVAKDTVASSFIEQVANFVKDSKQSEDASLPTYVGVFVDKAGQAALSAMGCKRKDPHVTVWHSSQEEPIDLVRSHVGKIVTLVCDAIFRSKTHTALRVSSMSLEDGEQLPCQNVFSHITLECPAGKAQESNDLPKEVEEGTATMELLSELLVFNGVVAEKE